MLRIKGTAKEEEGTNSLKADGPLDALGEQHGPGEEPRLRTRECQERQGEPHQSRRPSPGAVPVAATAVLPEAARAQPELPGARFRGLRSHACLRR